MTARRIRLARIPTSRQPAIERFTAHEREIFVHTLAESALAAVLKELAEEDAAAEPRGDASTLSDGRSEAL